VTAGPSREAIDDVRFISNRSSGLMGYSLAMAFRDAGARVTLISGPCGSLRPPSMVDLVMTENAAGLARAVMEKLPGTDLLAMVAAVSDFMPDGKTGGKLERSSGGLDIHLEPTRDILRDVAMEKRGTRILAYALEYGSEAEKRALEKMKGKGADAVFLNRGDRENLGMEQLGNAGLLLFPGGARVEIPPGSKRFVAEATVAALGRRFGGMKHGSPE
jgi:phosphopantothenoylcysteine decarboxylase/phosphopantothenate--cysteine ligase